MDAFIESLFEIFGELFFSLLKEAFTMVGSFLNKISMYKLVLYFLCFLFAAALVTGTLGYTPYSAFSILLSLTAALAVCSGVNLICAKVWNAIPNSESTFITAFILSLTMPGASLSEYTPILGIVCASAVAILSKYVLVYHKKHIFNPAAIGMVAASGIIGAPVNWWVAGNVALLPIVLIGGLLIVYKNHRFDSVAPFVIVASLATIILIPRLPWYTSLQFIFVHSSLLFFAGVMLTEPLTMPTTWRMNVLYGSIVGLLFAPPFHLFSIYFDPASALLIGNVFAFIVTPSRGYLLRFVEKITIAKDTYEFVFSADNPIPYKSGQYMEWTVSDNNSDLRGNRRSFTIASSPSEQSIRLAVKLFEPSSSFKSYLSNMHVDDTLFATHVSGDFVLPKNPEQPVVMIAGGIGITPFISQIREAIANNTTRPVTLFYSNKTTEEIAYKNILDKISTTNNLKTIYCITNPPPDPQSISFPIHTGYIDEKLIMANITDYKKAMYYISGPNSMVSSYKEMLRKVGIPSKNIKTDYFPGFI